MHTNTLKIIGCGGHGKVVIDALLLNQHPFQISLCDSNKERLGTTLRGLLIDATMESLIDFEGLVHVSIGSNHVRESVYKSLNCNNTLFTVIHPAAIISKSSTLGPGSFIAARAILGPESIIGEGCIINHGAVVDHEVKIGAYSHIAPNSTLGGNVNVGTGVLIGSGAIILPGITIGNGAIIGAGAVVVKDVKANTLVKGVPAV